MMNRVFQALIVSSCALVGLMSPGAFAQYPYSGPSSGPTINPNDLPFSDPTPAPSAEPSSGPAACESSQMAALQAEQQRLIDMQAALAAQIQTNQEAIKQCTQNINR